MKVSLVVAWYDIWAGVYYDRQAKALYVMIPFIGIRISKKKPCACGGYCKACHEDWLNNKQKEPTNDR